MSFGKAAGFGALVGLVIGAFMVLDGEPWWSMLAAPPLLASLSAATFGTGITLAWWLAPGRVRYAVNDASLIASRSSRTVKSIPPGTDDVACPSLVVSVMSCNSTLRVALPRPCCSLPPEESGYEARTGSGGLAGPKQ
jgi:hypothetical protein